MMDKSYSIDKDPIRKLVLNRIKDLGLTEVGVSASLGRNRAYINQYLYRGIPEVLPEQTRYDLARVLEIDEAQLRVEKFTKDYFGRSPTPAYNRSENAKILLSELAGAAIQAIKTNKSSDTVLKAAQQKITSYFWEDVETGKPPSYEQVLRMARALIGERE